MEHSDAKQEEKQDHQETSSLDRERKRIRWMKILFGVFSLALLLILILTLLNR